MLTGVMLLVLQQLDELVGDNKQAIVIDGRLLTDSGRIIYCKKSKHSVIFVQKERNGEDTIIPKENVQIIIQELLYVYNSTDMEPTTTTSVCRATNVLVVQSTEYLQLLETAKSPNRNISSERNLLLQKFLANEVENYFELYTKILYPKLSRVKSTKLKAHLVNNLFIPIDIHTKVIQSPFQYDIVRYICSKFLINTEVIDAPQLTTQGLHISVIAGCDLAESLGIPVMPFSPGVAMLAIMSRLSVLLRGNNGDAFRSRYIRELSAVFPNTENTQLTLQTKQKQTYFSVILSSQLFTI